MTNRSPNPEAICIALTGASGMFYGLRLLDCLLAAERRVILVYSPAAQIVAQQEVGLELPAAPLAAREALLRRFDRAEAAQLEVYAHTDWSAPIASGSNPPAAMVVCPCSMGTLGALAHGLADNLIERAADVVLKEGKKLILVPRETPYSVIHLGNMLSLARAGAVILPPNPGFYHHPRSVSELVDFVVARILDQLAVPHALIQPWGEER